MTMSTDFFRASPDGHIALIEARLNSALSPESLHVSDDGVEHAGHAGAATGGHYTVTIVAAAFIGKSRVARHRLVYDALANTVWCGIHALVIMAYTPDEFNVSSR
ncbi:MAG: BolA family protein [Burkholderia sp.]